MPAPWPVEVFRWYLRVLAASGGALIAPTVLALVVFAVCWTDRAPLPAWARRAALVASGGLGLVLALGHVSVLDDANYSFRYAENWIAGRGLVFNAGEYVEGYTNFLWTALLAAIAKVTPFRVHWLALMLGLISFVANVATIDRVAARLDGGRTGRDRLPVAAAFVAVHTTFVAFATSGLATMFASLLVDLGLLALVAGGGARGAATAGATFLLSTMARPDHALFWGAGLVALAVGHRGAIRDLLRGRPGAGLAPLAAYCAPLVPYGAYLLWKLDYYGTIVPNSFYARAADEPHVEQGLVYALVFLLGSHAWLQGALFGASFAVPDAAEPERAFRRFAAVAVPLWVAYVVWVGGDYLHGRFFVVLLPVVALGAERLVLAARRGGVGRLRTTPALAAVLGGLLLGSARGLPIVPPRQEVWGISDETTSTGHTWRHLVDPDEILASRARYAFDDLAAAAPDVAVEGTGGFAYRTRVRVVEACGLMDPEVARRETEDGHRTGHQKCLDAAELVDRGVRFSFTRNAVSMGFSAAVPRVGMRALDELCDGQGTCIHILAWDRDLMARLRRDVPSLQFVDFDAWLDAYVAGVDALPPGRVRADLPFLRAYWFDRNPDPARLARLEAAAGGTVATDAPLPHDPGGMSGFRDRMQDDAL